MKSSLHLSLEIRSQNNDKCQKGEDREGKQNDERPAVLTVIKMQGDEGADDRSENEIDQGEHIVLLRFQVGKKEHDAARKSAKADNGNNKQGKAVHKQKVNDYKQNTAPNGDLNGLADAVQLYKIGGEYKRPYHVKRQDNNDAPKRTFDTKIDNERGRSCRKEGPTYDG